MSKVSYLVLDFSKPIETRRALQSIRVHAKHDHQIVLLSNGGDQSYVWSLYADGLVDRLLVNKVNDGLGYSTETLFRFCDTEWAIYFQNDQELLFDITDKNIDSFVSLFAANPTIGALGLAGEPCGHNVYSERAHFINVPFYNAIPKTHGGCGPFNHLKYNEQAVQEYFKAHTLDFVALNPPIVRDIGYFTIRELPCGGVVKMRTDTKQVRWIKLPKEPYMFPDMTENEWTKSIAGQWTDGETPERYKAGAFNCWGDIEL